jgi:hypothetical protein
MEPKAMDFNATRMAGSWARAELAGPRAEAGAANREVESCIWGRFGHIVQRR